MKIIQLIVLDRIKAIVSMKGREKINKRFYSPA